jgi:hypothetical protein
MSRIVGGVLALALVLPALRAADKPGDKKVGSPAEQYQALVKEYGEAEQALMKAYQEAGTDEARQKVIKEKLPALNAFAPKFLVLAEKYPGDPVALDALLRVAADRPESDEGKDSPSARALAMLVRDHAAEPRLADLCGAMVYRYDPEAQAFLRALADRSPRKEVQGRACLMLGLHLQNLRTTVQQLGDYEGRLDRATRARLGKLDPDRLRREAQETLERAASVYPDFKTVSGATVGDQARRALDELRHLSLGQQAPEVEGTDADGKKFKLSDYRGKVVLLDFWGNW